MILIRGQRPVVGFKQRLHGQVQQSAVIAQIAFDEHWLELAKVIFFQCDDDPRGEMQACGDRLDGQAAGFPGSAKLLAYIRQLADGFGGRLILIRFMQGYLPST